MARFNGKKVIITKVANGIHKADELVERALQDAPIYNHSGDVEQIMKIMKMKALVENT